MFASESDAVFADLPAVILTLLAPVFGTVCSVFVRALSAGEGRAVCGQLMLMCIAYLEAIRLMPPPDA